MIKNIFLTALAAALLYSTAAEAYSHDKKPRVRHSYRKHYQQPRDYYPQQPQYLHSPVHKNVSHGVLGRVLGYEIAKDDAVASGFGGTNDDYLAHSAIKKR